MTKPTEAELLGLLLRAHQGDPTHCRRGVVHAFRWLRESTQKLGADLRWVAEDGELIGLWFSTELGSPGLVRARTREGELVWSTGEVHRLEGQRAIEMVADNPSMLAALRALAVMAAHQVARRNLYERAWRVLDELIGGEEE